MQARDLPTATFEHVVVLADSAGPARLAAEATEHRELVPATFRGAPIRREIDHRCELHARRDVTRREAESAAAELLVSHARIALRPSTCVSPICSTP